MAFAVVCKSCQARFLLNDDLLRRKVAGKVVTVRCRQCHATIEVDASAVDPKALPEHDAPAPPAPPAPVAHRTITLKAAPSPPRPVKSSTLMGIGTPAQAAGATELVALAPGLMNMTPAPPRPAPEGRGFPEPPPPPGAVAEELSAGDWDLSDAPTPPLAKALPTRPLPAKVLPSAPMHARTLPMPPAPISPVPESLDDFVEELPPSSRPVEEEMPSSAGTPTLKALAHHDESAPKTRSDDFLANMSAAMNGGITAGAVNAPPTIDVSTLAAAPVAADGPPSVDISDFDVPVAGKRTLPLFALGDGETAESASQRAPARPAPAHARPLAAADGSLSPAALDRPRAGEPAESVRERKNVVAPSTKSVPPPAAPHRTSGLAVPVLLALAAAAGFLIWKRNASAPSTTAARAEEPAHVAAPPRVAEPTPLAAPEPALAESAAAPAPTEADDVTFETTPVKPSSGAVAAPREHAAAADAATTPPGQSGAKPEPTSPIAKAEPKEPKEAEPRPTPAGRTEPTGPFDRAAATAALTAGAAQASSCKKEGDPSGVASVTITFAPSGRVTSANISGPPFAGTATGGCIAAALRKAHIPPFDGDRVTVSKTIVIQ